MNEKYQVSAVIPAYNAGAYIGRAIESVLNQSRKADEIIIVDDGSTDDTADQIKRFGDKVRYIYQENAGASAARNAGIKAAKYDWISFLDGDDQWTDNKLELQIALLEDNPKLHWAMGYYLQCSCQKNNQTMLPSKEIINTHLHNGKYFDDFLDAFSKRCLAWTGTFTISKHALEQAGMFRVNQPRYNDIEMWFRIAYLFPEIGFVTEPIGIYHIDIPDSITRKHVDMSIFYELIDRHIALSSEANCHEQFAKCVKFLLTSQMRSMVFNKQSSDIRFIIKKYKNYVPWKFRLIMNILTVWPMGTTMLLKTLRWALHKIGKGKVVRKNNFDIDNQNNKCTEELKKYQNNNDSK